jgi:hypothetical protein
MSDQSTHLQLPLLAQGQAQKHVTVNESLLRLDALVQLSVISATTGAQPASPADGDLYILTTGKSGVSWSAMADASIAYYRDGAWEELIPREGWRAYVKDIDALCAFNGVAWTNVVSGLARTGAANTFTASQTINASSAMALALAWNDDGANGVGVTIDKNSASPAANDDIFAFTVSGRDSAAASVIYGTFSCRIASPTAGAHSGLWSFATRQAGVNTTVVRFGAGIYHPSAAGGDKGANTINFGAVYDDNSLLTCAPLELLQDGAVDFDKWDGLASLNTEPGAAPRRHDAARLFETMLNDGFDPRDPDAFCARMRADRAVPGLYTEKEWRALADAGEKPDIGSMQTRIMLALDNLAVAFAGAMARIAALETRGTPLDVRPPGSAAPR